MFCRKCGTQLPDDAMFCSECGSPTRNHQSQQQPYQEQPYQGQPYQQPYQQSYQQPYPAYGAENARAKFSGGSKRVLITVAIVAVIAVVVGLLYHFVLKTSNPEDTMKEFESAVEDLDLEKMMACFDVETREMFEESMSSVDSFDINQALNGVLGLAGGLGIGPEVDIMVKDVEYLDSSNCEVTVDIRISFMGKSESVEGKTVPMTKEDKKWVIDVSVADEMIGGLF